MSDIPQERVYPAIPGWLRLAGLDLGVPVPVEPPISDKLTMAVSCAMRSLQPPMPKD